jgi:hypothetical protein
MTARKENLRWKQLGWFALLWVGGVGAVMLVASVLKLVMAARPS